LSISFAVKAGRGVTAQRFLDIGGMQKLRSMFEAAAQKLNSSH
jgi:hypothetical protein